MNFSCRGSRIKKCSRIIHKYFINVTGPRCCPDVMMLMPFIEPMSQKKVRKCEKKLLFTNIFGKYDPAFMNQFYKFQECFRPSVYTWVCYMSFPYLGTRHDLIYSVHTLLFVKARGRQDNCYA